MPVVPPPASPENQVYLGRLSAPSPGLFFDAFHAGLCRLTSVLIDEWLRCLHIAKLRQRRYR